VGDVIVSFGGPLVGVAIAATIGIRKWKTGGFGKWVAGLWVAVPLLPFVLLPLPGAVPTELREPVSVLAGVTWLADIVAAIVVAGIWVLRTILKRE